MKRKRSNKGKFFILPLIALVIFAAAMGITAPGEGLPENGAAGYVENGGGAAAPETEGAAGIEAGPPGPAGEAVETAGIEAAPEETSARPPATEPPVKKNNRAYRDKFDGLRALYNGNEDIIGIIKIPGTVVYYPVAYYAYDNDYYLGRNLFKQISAAGSIFLDYENSIERYDPNTVLYGHQMSFNSMFHTLRYYADEDFFNEHRYIIFNTVYEDNVWEVFAFFRAHISFNYIKVFFKSERAFLELAAEIKARSLYESGIDIKEGDRILTLSTCTNEDRDTRYVLSARMVKNKDEIPEEIAMQMAGAVEEYK